MSCRHLAIALVALFAAATASAQLLVARLGTSLPDVHPQTIGARKFAELVEMKTNGRIKITVHSAAQLGSDQQMVNALRAGTQEFTVPSSATLANLVKDFGILGLPFAFTSEKQADAVLDGAFGRQLLGTLPGQGLIGLAYWENGFRNLTNSQRPITRIEDVAGLRVRTMQNAQYIDLFNQLGAKAVPLPVNELYAALESHAVDAQENPFTVIHAQRLYNVQGYLSITRHAYDVLILVVSKKFWDKLAPADQVVLRDAATEATRFQREVSRDLNDRLKAELLKLGMKVNDISYGERRRMRDRVNPVFNKYVSGFDLSLSIAFVSAILNASP